MEQSILKSVKKVLGIEATYTAFDLDIVMHVNSAFSTLNQLGIGPEEGFAIDTEAELWTTFLGTDPRLNSVKTYVFLKVRQIFDPPATSYLIEAFNKQIEELEWRLNVYREKTEWTNPYPVVLPDEEELVLDGGSP